MPAVVAAAVLAELHDLPDELLRGEDRGPDVGLADLERSVPGSGMSVGLWSASTLPSVSVTSYSTLGIVASSSRSYSRSSRSRTMSMCSRPRKPQRKPNPSASEVSGSQESAASLSVSFSSASRRSG